MVIRRAQSQIRRAQSQCWLLHSKGFTVHPGKMAEKDKPVAWTAGETTALIDHFSSHAVSKI